MLAPSPDRPPLIEDTQFVLKVLGPFELSGGSDKSIILVPSEKMRTLLTYLAAAPGYAETRGRLAMHLWPASTERQARQNLRQLLSTFRRSAADVQHILISDDSTIRLAPDIVAIDRDGVLNVPREAETDDLIRRVDLYRGVFGAGLATQGDDDESWLVSEQNRTRDAAIMLLDRLVRRLAEEGRQNEALDYANRLFSLDQFREETHRLVIVQRAAVYGRASAMTFYEQVRQLLRQELMVAPEAATRQLIDSLRDLPAPPDVSGLPLRTLQTTAPRVGFRQPDMRQTSRRPTWRWSVVAATMGLITAVAAGLAYPFFASDSQTVRYVGEAPGRTSVALMPFEVPKIGTLWRDRASSLETETRQAFQRMMRLSVVDVPPDMASMAPVALGRKVKARYVIATQIAIVADEQQANISLVDTETGISKALAPVLLNESNIKFAREMFRSVFTAITINRSEILAQVDPDSVSALLWRALATRVGSRLGAAVPREIELFEAVIAREPNQLLGLLGLAEALVLRVAREQSSTREADIERIGSLLANAREQVPNEPEIAFQEGMWHKLQGQFQQADDAFRRTVRLDRAHWNAAAQVAHLKIFAGRFEEAYREMEAASDHLLPDIGAAETAYIAGETALVAGDVQRAVTYLDQAVAGNPTVSRIRGMQAAALWLAGREQEARATASKSTQLVPPYSPARMAKRGSRTGTPRYHAARDLYVAAYAAALAPVAPEN